MIAPSDSIAADHPGNVAATRPDSVVAPHSETPVAPHSSAIVPAPSDSVSALQPWSNLTLPPDTMPIIEKSYALLLEAPAPPPEVKPNPGYSPGMSVIFATLFLLICIIGLRFRNNGKYATALFHNLVEVRVRGNVFDETVRETSFIVLLNILWCYAAGIILSRLIYYSLPSGPENSFGIPALTLRPGLCTGICIMVMIVYAGFMSITYFTVGTVFADKRLATIWLKGFAASQGLMSILFLPISLLLLFYPGWHIPLLWTALATFLTAKMIFIHKGFRIFFTQFSSWVLFLYYLCSLEIVPLILTYMAACRLCSLL